MILDCDISSCQEEHCGFVVEWLATRSTDSGVRDSNPGRAGKYFWHALVSPSYTVIENVSASLEMSEKYSQ